MLVLSPRVVGVALGGGGRGYQCALRWVCLPSVGVRTRVLRDLDMGVRAEIRSTGGKEGERGKEGRGEKRMRGREKRTKARKW